MSQQIEIHAELRVDVGKGASRRLRRQAEKVPGIIYGGTDDAVPLTMSSIELTKVMKQESFYSQILNVVVDGKGQQALVRDLQRHPATERVMHIDFLRIRADRAIQVPVPLHFIDEDKCIGVKEGGGSIIHNLTQVEVSCLPGDLPEYLEVFMALVDLNQSVRLSDLAVPEGVTIVALAHGPERDVNVVSVQIPRGGIEEEEELEAAEAAAAAAAEGEEAEGDEAGDAEGADEEPSEG
ncbi:MAG: 50S ribosomal protein L25/general stress protein Ctc [Gammaproteobacteria bacterium]|nr:50S ribosomal protein L25/general stress protein Ctc [Gammaproteobacteria bacterium]